MLAVVASLVDVTEHGWRLALRTVFGRALGLTLLLSGVWPLVADAQSATIAPRITATTITLPQPLEGATDNFCTWGACTLGPRLYQAPMVGGSTLIGWTDASCNGHVSRVNGSTIQQTFDFPATPVRGLVVHPDNSFAVLLLDFNNGNTDYYTHFMELSLLNASGAVQWTTELLNNAQIGSTPGVVPAEELCAAYNASNGQYWVGDSRLGYGGGQYGAYFAVHAEPDASGLEHDGDQLTIVNDAGAVQGGGWQWGLSHSLTELIDYHSDLARLTAVGVSDCFPPVSGATGSPPHSPGLDADYTNQIVAAAGNCGGLVSLQLGQMAAVTGGSWLVAFNGQSQSAFTDAFGNPEPAWVGKGIGVVSFNGSYAATPVKWLTNTTGTDERDAVLARIGTSLASNRFLVGWHLQTEGTFNMAVIDPTGKVLSPAEAVSPTAGWGNRDDSLKTRPDGSISWLQGNAGATSLQLYRYAETAPTNDFTGERTSDILWRYGDGQAEIWFMSAGKVASRASLGIVPTSWTIAAVGDFNGDGTTDILWRNSDGQTQIWFLNGGGVSSKSSLGVIPANWTLAGTGDFNGDGTTDILWRYGDGQAEVWFMSGGKVASRASLGIVATSWTIVGTGDFNGDGTTDILWRNSDGETQMWFMSGGKVASKSSFGVIPANWTLGGTGDFNGDGTTDILWRYGDGQAEAWFMSGGKVASRANLGVMSSAWTIVGTGDFNGDGNTDITWRNADGTTEIWLMKGGKVNSTDNLGVVPTGWTFAP